MGMESTALHGALVIELYMQGVGMHEECTLSCAYIIWSGLYNALGCILPHAQLVDSTIHMEYTCTLLCMCLVTLLYDPHT